jgi:2-dehydro-3-deoxygalactonokinase
MFTARSGVLLGDFGADAIADRLSGLVIGAEIAGGLALGWAKGPLRLVGDAVLSTRYRIALDVVGLASETGPADAAVEGFRRLSALEGVSP